MKAELQNLSSHLENYIDEDKNRLQHATEDKDKLLERMKTMKSILFQLQFITKTA